MADDIVRRMELIDVPPGSYDEETLYDAVAEIERLRAAGDMLFQMLGDIHAWTADGEIEALNAWQEARRG